MKNMHHSTHIGYGFYVTNQELNHLSTSNQQAFKDNQYTIIVNEYDPENTDYFFGIKMASLTEGQGFCLPSRWNLSDEVVETMINEFKRYFYDKAQEGCHDYILTDCEEIE